MSILKHTSKQSVFNFFYDTKSNEQEAFDESARTSKTFARASLDSPVVYM